VAAVVSAAGARVAGAVAAAPVGMVALGAGARKEADAEEEPHDGGGVPVS
jgi:hypothetical protein